MKTTSKTEPRDPLREARKAISDRYDDLRWCGKDDLCNIKAEGAYLALTDFEAALRASVEATPGLDEQLDIDDELLDADHEIAGFLHPLFWGDAFIHNTEPGDGDDCHECYEQSERLRVVIAHAILVARDNAVWHSYISRDKSKDKLEILPPKHCSGCGGWVSLMGGFDGYECDGI